MGIPRRRGSGHIPSDGEGLQRRPRPHRRHAPEQEPENGPAGPPRRLLQTGPENRGAGPQPQAQERDQEGGAEEEGQARAEGQEGGQGQT